MTSRSPRDLTASIRGRLLDVARKSGDEFQFVLTRYVIERFLYRLSESSHGKNFVLKGAMLFPCWGLTSHRTTRDVDLLGRGDSSLAGLSDVIRAVCRYPVDDDGLAFNEQSVSAVRIKSEQEYEGVRVTCEVLLGTARVQLQIDVGFGDAVSPRAVSLSYPTLLDSPAPVLKTYRRETVIAEKLQAMVQLGIANTRMKDFFDIWMLSREFEFDGATLSKAISTTFRRRKLAIPQQVPIALTPEFSKDSLKSNQWTAFLRRHRLQFEALPLSQVVEELAQFLVPPMPAIREPTNDRPSWTPPGPWK
jgi:predicted nucleotidyltransferase component of viral defense system